MNVAWVIGLIINIICLVTYHLNERDASGDISNRKLMRENWMPAIEITNFVFSGLCFIVLVVWLIFRADIQYSIHREDYLIEHPGEKPEGLSPFTRLSLILSTFTQNKTAVNMFFHVIFGILGSLVDPFFHTLHLLLYVNISDSAMYILKAWVSKSGALINTLLLTLFIIFAYSVLNANFYAEKFDIEGLDVCSSLASCYLYSLS